MDHRRHLCVCVVCVCARACVGVVCFLGQVGLVWRVSWGRLAGWVVGGMIYMIQQGVTGSFGRTGHRVLLYV